MKLRGLFALALSLASLPAIAQVTPGTSPLSGAKGGTNNAFMQFTGPAASLKTFTLPNASDTIATLAAIQTFSAAKTFSAITTISNATASTTPADGALVIAGGLGVGGAMRAGATVTSGPYTGVGAETGHFVAFGGSGATGGGHYAVGKNGTENWLWGHKSSVLSSGTSSNWLLYSNGIGNAIEVDLTTMALTLGTPLPVASGGTAATTAATARTNLGVAIGTNVQAWDADLDCLAAIGTTGIVARTGAGTCAVRTITAPAAGITFSNGDGVAGNPTLALANDLAALEGLAGTGIARRTGADAWSVGTAVSNAELATMAANTIKGNATGSAAVPTDISIPALTQKVAPVANDKIMIADSAATDALKYATVSSISAAGSVASIAGNTGAFTLSTGLTNSTNDIRRALNEATLAGAPANPTGTSSATEVMMGLGVTTCRLAPVYSTRMMVIVSGILSGGNATNVSYTGRYGTGAGPANGAAATGTTFSRSTSNSLAGTGASAGFSASNIITGLTPSTTYWFDMSFGTSNTGAASNLVNVTCTAMEF